MDYINTHGRAAFNSPEIEMSKTTTIRIPATHAEALEDIAALDAAKWGEEERQPSRDLNRTSSYGLLLNALAHRPEYGYGKDVPHLVAAAKEALTAADKSLLRKGG